MIYNNNSKSKNNTDSQDINNSIECIEIECICDNNTYEPKNKLIKCFLCNKYQHLSCIFQAKYIRPYLCFNCQFQYNHFYLRWKKTILPAKEIIYSNKWVKDKSLLKKGRKKFRFVLDLNELYKLNNDNSHFLAFIWMTNNGKPFHFGFPDNTSIKINNNDFYSTDNKQFKYPLLLSLNESNDYSPKKKHLITDENYEIPLASEFFRPPKIVNSRKKSSLQTVTISFDNPLENYYGSEFEFEETRRYLFYIGIFQEIKIPQLSILKNCNKLIEFNEIFKNLYKEKVMKMKWNEISNNIILSDNEEMNMNLISSISNQKIVHPVRGLFCQHSDVLDFGECCRYITSKNQIYKCYKCNKPLNIVYIDDATDKIFNEFKNTNFTQIYFNNKFNFIKGEKISLNNQDIKDDSNEMEISNNESDSLNESFFEFYQNQPYLIESPKNNNNIIEKEPENIGYLKEKENNYNNKDDIIELNETISLSSSSDNSDYDNDSSISFISEDISEDFVKKKRRISNIKKNKKGKKNIDNKDKDYEEEDEKSDDLKIVEIFSDKKGAKQNNIKNNLLKKKRIRLSKNKSIKNKSQNNKNCKNELFNKKHIDLSKKDLKKKSHEIKKNINIEEKEEVISLSQSSDNNFNSLGEYEDSSMIINEINSIQNYSTNTNDEKNFIHNNLKKQKIQDNNMKK